MLKKEKVLSSLQKAAIFFATAFSILAVVCFFGYNGFSFVKRLFTTVTGLIIVELGILSVLAFKFLPVKKWLKKLMPTEPLNIKERAYVIICGVICLIWTISFLNIGYGPDEYMRYDVPKFIYENNALPFGDEESIRNPNWGFSYGFLITMPNLIGAAFMKIMQLFSSQEHMLLIAARMVNVFCNMGTAYFAIKITKKIFNTPVRWILIVLTTLMPQMVFISSHVNNDAFAYMTAMAIIYSWIRGLETHWNLRSCVILAVANGACLVSYRNYFSFVLCSFFVYLVSFIRFRKIDFDVKRFIKQGLIIIGIALIVCGPIYFRAVLLYGTDIFGTAHAWEMAELYARPDLKPDAIAANSMLARGVTVCEMVFDLKWLKATAESMCYCFGYMEIFPKEWIYNFYYGLATVGVSGIAIRLLRTKKEISEQKLRSTSVAGSEVFNYTVITAFMAIAGIITVILCIYRAYTADFQTMGKYVYPILPTLLFLIVHSIESIINQLFGRFEFCQKIKTAVTAIICTVVIITMLDGFMACVKNFSEIKLQW